jgi:aldehyde dehydrogenase (NAD+)
VAAELYALLDTSDLPGGALNLVTGPVDELADTLASHAEVDALWWPSATHGPGHACAAAVGSNLKRTWVGGAVDTHTALLARRCR